jgi:hypothetical protein
VHSDQSNAALANLKMSALLIPWIKSNNNVHEEIIKWSHDNAECEICLPVIKDLEWKMLMPHCLAVKTKIEQVVTIDAHRWGPSLFRVFSRTTSACLQMIWDIVIVNEDPQETAEDFETILHSFIASHSTADDQHELLTQLQNPSRFNPCTVACAK